MSIENLNIVVFREGGAWVAHCVEIDIGAQAPDLKSLRRRIGLTIELELQESIRRNGSPFAGIDAAPACVREKWQQAKAAGQENWSHRITSVPAPVPLATSPVPV